MPLTKATQNVIEGIVSTGSTGLSAGSFIVGQQYKITSLGTTTQSQWNTIAGTTGQTYVVGSLFTAATDGASSGNGAAAVARTLANRFADVVNVNDFGADPTGTNNSVSAFIAANSTATANASIYVPAGTYLLNSDVNIQNRKIIANGATFTGSGKLINGLLETTSGFVSRQGSYVAAGTPADIIGVGKGGFLVGGGQPNSTNGTFISCDGATNWLAVLPSKNYNPQEFIIYSSSGQGYATSVSGTGNITRVTGTEFDSNWIGKTLYFLRKKFKVSSVANINSLTVTELDNSPVTFSLNETEAYNYFYTSGSGLCNVNGSTVTFVSGDPFVPLFFTDFEFTLNGTPYTISSFDSVTQYTLSSPFGTGTNIPFTWRGNINDQITTLRVQAIQGSDEENVNLMSIAGDNFLGRYYTLNTGTAGSYGQYRPIFIGSGNYTDLSYQHQIGCYPRNYLGSGGQGYVSLGGVQGREGLRVLNPNTSAALENRFEVQGAASTFAPSLRVAGSDANIALALDAKGNGEFSVTQDFTRTIFKAQSVGSTVNWLNLLASSTGVPTEIYADGANTDIGIKLTPKGSEYLWYGNYVAGATSVTGYIMIKDSSGNQRKLAVIA
jgi:hypothetical protein